MADLEIKSYEQILGDLISSLQSRVGLNDLNPGSVILDILEAAAQQDFNISNNIFAALDEQSVDRAIGTALDLLAQEEGLTRYSSSKTSGAVTVVDNSFQKKSTNIYPNQPPPIIGSTIIYVNDASTWPTSGSLYISRGTSNVEGPINYSSIILIGTYYQINLSAALAKKHSTGDFVILSQGGNRVLPAGTIIQTATIGAAASIPFSIINSITIPDGETTIQGIPVLCNENGTVGNIASNSLTQFAAAPFPNLSVKNEVPFSNGRDVETDFELRDRIKRARQSRSKGTNTALINAVTGLVATDEQKRVLSSSVEESTDLTPTILRIDDGTSYEPIFTSVGQESIIDEAIGGEKYLQLANVGLVKAQLTTQNTQPFEIFPQYKLSVMVGGVLSEHTFSSSDFQSNGAATAYEIVSSINSNSLLLFSARTSAGGSRVVIFAKADNNENLQIVAPVAASDANLGLGFSLNKVYSLRLYKNDKELRKDGQYASVTSIPFPWVLPLFSYTLEVGIDNTPSIIYTFDSINLNPYTPSTAPLETWKNAINKTIPGITASINGNRLVLTSNKGQDDLAALTIGIGGTLVSLASIFAAATYLGKSSEYSLIRGTGQIKLNTPAAPGDNYKAGTTNFRAYALSSSILGGTLVLANPANLWLVVDASTEIISHNAVPGTLISVTNPLVNIWRYTGTTNTFLNVKVGDWVVNWDNSFSANNQGYWRISKIDIVNFSYIEIEKSLGTVEAIVLINPNSITFARTSGIVQQITIPVGTYSMDALATAYNAILIGATASVFGADKIKITTNNFLESEGKISLLSADLDGTYLGFITPAIVSNEAAHIASVQSNNSELGSPLFVNYLIENSNNSANPPVFVSSVAQNINPDNMLAFLKPLLTDRYSSNRYNYDGVSHLVVASTNISLLSKNTIKERLTSDRAYISNSFDFSYDDKLSVVIDDDPTNKTLNIPLFRTITITNSPAPTINTFSATDFDGGGLSLLTTFGGSFSFTNYRLWLKAKNVIDPDGTDNAFIVKSIHYGPTGELYRFSIQYPTAPNLSFSYSVVSGNSIGGIDVNIFLPSGTARTKTHDNTTQIAVTVVGVGPYDVTYTWTGLGSAPAWLANNVTIGDIVTIPTTSTFNSVNEGTFRITNVTATAITVTNHAYNGIPVAETVTLNSANDFTIYPIDVSSTATALINYINTNLGDYISAVLGVGQTGSGIIDRSTHDFTGSTSLFVSLIDGENWVYSSNLSGSPQFTIEKNLTSLAPLYSLVGENVVLIPHTAQQIQNFLNKPAVSSLSNLSGVLVSSNGGKIEINSQNTGTVGAVKISGGKANLSGGTVVNNDILVGSPTQYSLIRTNYGSTIGLHKGQWLQFTSATPLKKNLGLSNTTFVSISGAPINTITITAGSGSFKTQRVHSGDNTTNITVEKHGNFVAFIWTAGTNPNFVNVVQGDFVIIPNSSNFSAQNCGTFRVIRALSNMFWVENSLAIEETKTITGNSDLQFFSADSVLPGDTLILSGSILNSNNNGTYTVFSSTSTTITINETFQNSIVATNLGAGFDNLKSYDKNIAIFYKQIKTIAQKSAFSSVLSDIILTDSVSQLLGKINDIYGFTFIALNKLNFAEYTTFGIDAYSTYKGLIGESTKVVYGDPRSPSLYPGVKAAGTYIDILPPLPKRIKISLGIRLRTGTPFSTVLNNIRSTAAGIINNTKIGQSISLSDIVRAVQQIDGVYAVSIIYPNYTSANDVIVVNPNEKPIVVSENDVSVTFL